MSDFEDAWDGYRLVTAEILYHLPDHPLILQTYIWQEFDKPNTYPNLQDFLQFWLKEIDGKLHEVKVCVGGPLMPSSVSAPTTVFAMH